MSMAPPPRGRQKLSFTIVLARDSVTRKRERFVVSNILWLPAAANEFASCASPAIPSRVCVPFGVNCLPMAVVDRPVSRPYSVSVTLELFLAVALPLGAVLLSNARWVPTAIFLLATVPALMALALHRFLPRPRSIVLVGAFVFLAGTVLSTAVNADVDAVALAEMIFRALLILGFMYVAALVPLLEPKDGSLIVLTLILAVRRERRCQCRLLPRRRSGACRPGRDPPEADLRDPRAPMADGGQRDLCRSVRGCGGDARLVSHRHARPRPRRWSRGRHRYGSDPHPGAQRLCRRVRGSRLRAPLYRPTDAPVGLWGSGNGRRARAAFAAATTCCWFAG